MTEDEIEKMTQDIKDEEESSEDGDDSDSGIDFGTEHKIV
jgi:hypothetical protein